MIIPLKGGLFGEAMLNTGRRSLVHGDIIAIVGQPISFYELRLDGTAYDVFPPTNLNTPHHVFLPDEVTW